MSRNKLTLARRRPPAAFNAILVVVALALAFIAAEVFLRLVYHPENLGTVIRFDASLGWSLEPGAHMHSVDNMRDLDYKIDISSLGLRDREITVQPEPGVKRILVLGDSFVFGAGVETQWRMTDVMGRALGADVEVINAGVSGWGTDQEVVHYETVLRKLHPDVVVLTMMVANDVINNMLDHLFLTPTTPKPRFYPEGDRLVWSGPIAKPKSDKRINLRALLRKSRVIVLTKRSMNVFFDRPEQDRGVAAESGLELEWMRRGYSHWLVYEHEHQSTLEEGWSLTEGILRRLAEDCAGDGAELVVMAFPLKIEVQDEWRARLMSRAGVEESALDLDRPYERLGSFCEANGIEFMYPLEEFREGAKHRDLYFRLDGHPNRYGHIMAARVLLDRLKAFHEYNFAIPPADRAEFAALR